MNTARSLQQFWEDEDGGTGVSLLMMSFLVAIMTPFFWDIASVHYTRRMSTVGSDFAGLAAAQEYARLVEQVPSFNGIFLGSCIKQEYTQHLVLLRYMTNPAFQGDAAIGQILAALYATHNINDLTGFGLELDFNSGPSLFGIRIPVFKVYDKTKRDVHTAYRSMYGRDFDVPNKAAAAAFLSSYLVIPQPCPGGGWTFDFWLEWKVTLFAEEADTTVQVKCVSSDQSAEMGFSPGEPSDEYASDSCTVNDNGDREYADVPPLYCTLPPDPETTDAPPCNARDPAT